MVKKRALEAPPCPILGGKTQSRIRALDAGCIASDEVCPQLSVRGARTSGAARILVSKGHTLTYARWYQYLQTTRNNAKGRTADAGTYCALI